MTSKQGYNPDFTEFLNQKIRVNLKDKRSIIGVVEQVDHFMNMVIDDAQEVEESGKSRELFKAIIRGSQVLNWDFLE